MRVAKLGGTSPHKGMTRVGGVADISVDVLWGGKDYIVANVGVVDIITSGSVWDITSASGTSGNISHGGRVSGNFTTVVGVTYEYTVETDRDVNLVVYDIGFSIIEFVNALNTVTFVATETTTRLYICPRDTTIVRCSNAQLRQQSHSIST